MYFHSSDWSDVQRKASSLFLYYLKEVLMVFWDGNEQRQFKEVKC